MNQSETISDLAAALVEAKKKFLPALKTATNPAFKSKYTDLATAIAATETALLESGLVVMQFAGCQPEVHSVFVTSRLLHKSGQYIEDTIGMPATGRNGFDAQSVGSAITYARRYALMAMLGIAPEDDDGNLASGGTANGNGKEIVRKSEKAAQIGIAANDEPIFDQDGEPVVMRPAAPPVTQKPSSKFVSGSTVGIPRGKRLFAIAMGAGRSKEELNNYLGSIGVERCEEVPVSEYEKACTWAAGV